MTIPKQDERTPGYPVILNGDHAEFEREHASTPPKERPDWPLPSFDARDWAEAFDKLFIVSRIDGYATKPVDDHVGLMMGWFANALMRGFDEHAARVNAYTSTEALKSALEACAEFLRNKGIPCGAYSMPAPGEIDAAQAAFDRELEAIIEEMKVEVPRMVEQRGARAIDTALSAGGK